MAQEEDASLPAIRRASTGTVATTATAPVSSTASSTASSPSLLCTPRRSSMTHVAERRVSFSGTDRVREFNLGDSERKMKIEAKRESKMTRRQHGIDGIRLSASADDLMGDDQDPDAQGAEVRSRSYSDSQQQQQQQQQHGDPNMFDDPFSAERVVSSLFTSLIHTTSAAASEEPKRRSSHDGIITANTMMDRGADGGEDMIASSTSSASILAAARQRRRASIAEERARRRSLDLWSAPQAAKTNTSTSTSTAAGTHAQPTRTVQQRRSSLELWSAPTAQKRTPNNNSNRLVEGLAQLRLMSGTSRRLSPSGGVTSGGAAGAVTRRRNSMMAAAPTTGGTATYNVPLNDADGEAGGRRRSSTSADASRRRHSLDVLTRAADVTLGDESTDVCFRDNEPTGGRFTTERGGDKNIVIINGKRIQRRTLARRRTSLEMEDEPNAADVLDYMCEPQSSRSHLVLTDLETRRQMVKADAQRDRAARRRHSVTLMPCGGWMDASCVETTFTNDAGTLGIRRTQSFDGSVLPSAILAEEMATEQDISESIDHRKDREDFNAATVGTSEITELSSDEHALDGASLHDDDDNSDNSPFRTASSSCETVRRGSMERNLHKEDEASALPPLNITIHQRRRTSPEATTEAGPRQRRSSDFDVGRPPARRTSADRTVDNLFTMKTSRPSTTGATADPRRRSSREPPRRRTSQSAVETGDANDSSVPQQEGRRARPTRAQRNSQQSQKQRQQHPASASSGVYSQGRRRHSMDSALNSFLTWHREEKLPEGDSGGSTDAIAGTEPAEDKLPKAKSFGDIQMGLATELIQDTDGVGKATK